MKGGGHALLDIGLLSPVLCSGPDSAPAGDVFRVVFAQEAPDAVALNGSSFINHSGRNVI